MYIKQRRLTNLVRYRLYKEIREKNEPISYEYIHDCIRISSKSQDLIIPEKPKKGLGLNGIELSLT